MSNVSLLIVENYPFLGVLSSIILIFGFYELGTILFKVKIVKEVFTSICQEKYLKIFISSNLFLIINYQLILIFNLKFLFIFSSFVIFFLGLKKILYKIVSFRLKDNFLLNKNHFKVSLNNFDKYLFLLLITLYFLLSFSPFTHGDALGYHLFVALSILKNAIYPISLFHFHSFLSGAGEIFISLGLLFGSEQFINVIQVVALIPVLGIIKKISNKNYFYLLLIILSPTLVFLVSASKPQLYFACSNFVIFSLFVLKFQKTLFKNQLDAFGIYFISIIILIISVHGKFSFILSSGIIGMMILYHSIIHKKFSIFCLSLVSASLILYFPVIIFKTLNFGGNIFDYMFTPIPTSLIGSDLMNPYIVNYKRHESFLYLFFPKSIGQITYSIGAAFLYLFFILFVKKKDKTFYLISGAIFLFIFINIFKGPLVARFFIEPYFWLILLTTYYSFYNKIKLVDYLNRFQGLILIPILFYGIYSLSIGSISQKSREKVLEENANGYLLFKWANQKLNNDDTVIVAHRSIGFAEFNAISDEFVSWAIFDNDKTKKIYKDLLIKKNPRYILGEEKYLMLRYKKCLGKLVSEGININKHAARNPFNKSNNRSNVYIYEFELGKFPECVEQ